MGISPSIKRNYNFKDLTGQRFTRLLVIELAEIRNGLSYWLCQCDCTPDKRVVVRGAQLLSGRTKSCGCLRKENASVLHQRNTRHGMYGTPIYHIWTGMKDRCLNPKSPSYYKYGGRGITIHPDWVNSFEAFYQAVGPRPSPQHSIERIDNSLGYVPGNVRWATRLEQAHNKRNNRFLTFNEQTKCLSEWADLLDIPFSTLYNRLLHGWSVEKTLTTPKRPKRRRRSPD